MEEFNATRVRQFMKWKITNWPADEHYTQLEVVRMFQQSIKSGELIECRICDIFTNDISSHLRTMKHIGTAADKMEDYYLKNKH